MPRMLHRYPELFQGLSWEVAFPCSAPDPSWKWFFPCSRTKTQPLIPPGNGFSLLQDQNSAPSSPRSLLPALPCPSQKREGVKGKEFSLLPPERSWELSPVPGNAPAPSRRKTAIIGNIPGWNSTGWQLPLVGKKSQEELGCAPDVRHSWSGIPGGAGPREFLRKSREKDRDESPRKGRVLLPLSQGFLGFGTGFDVFQLFHLYIWVSVSLEWHPRCFLKE